MEKIQLDIYGLSSSHSSSGSFALVLGEIEGKRRLPIIIGMFEAQSIALELENIPSKRPLTHDLFKTFSQSFSIEVKEIIISKFKDGVFYAEIVATDGLVEHKIDSRPSDAVAIALRFQAPMYTNEKILSEAGIIINEEPDDIDAAFPLQEEENEVSIQAEENINELSVGDLERLLNDAIAEEDYEKAAKIRDEINKKK